MAAVLCATSATFCWVARSIWLTKDPTWATPALCSTLAALLSAMMAVMRCTAATPSVRVAPARSTWAVLCFTRSTLALIGPLISRTASALRRGEQAGGVTRGRLYRLRQVARRDALRCTTARA